MKKRGAPPKDQEAKKITQNPQVKDKWKHGNTCGGQKRKRKGGRAEGEPPKGQARNRQPTRGGVKERLCRGTQRRVVGGEQQKTEKKLEKGKKRGLEKKEALGNVSWGGVKKKKTKKWVA